MTILHLRNLINEPRFLLNFQILYFLILFSIYFFLHSSYFIPIRISPFLPFFSFSLFFPLFLFFSLPLSFSVYSACHFSIVSLSFVTFVSIDLILAPYLKKTRSWELVKKEEINAIQLNPYFIFLLITSCITWMCGRESKKWFFPIEAKTEKKNSIITRYSNY